MKNTVKLLSILLILSIVFVGCEFTREQENIVAINEEISENTSPLETGSMTLKVNPEIKVHYNKDGKVTNLESKNSEANNILKGYTSYENKDVDVVIRRLVEIIGEQGYFLEEVEGERKEIILELEKGSVVPKADFIDKIVKSVEEYVNSNKWDKEIIEANYDLKDITKEVKNEGPVVVLSNGNNTNYATNYSDTNYDSPYKGRVNETTITTIPVEKSVVKQPTIQQPAVKQPAPNNHTDYDSPYTDYDSPYDSNSPYTDYADSPYDSNSPNTNYEDSPYTDYDDTDYAAPAPSQPVANPQPAPAPAPAPKADSPYSDYDSPYSDYDDSGYDDSDYD